MDAQEAVALTLVALTAAALLWRGWRRRRGNGHGLPCCHCGGGSARENIHLRATKDGPVQIHLRPPAG